MSNYLKYRGKCKEMSEQLVAQDPTLTLVRGWYHCYQWGKQAHWWCKTATGEIVDPTKLQFPSGGLGEYEEFSGMVECEQCGRQVSEEDAKFYGRYAFCSESCLVACVL